MTKKALQLSGLLLLGVVLFQGIKFAWKEYNYNWKFIGQLDHFTAEGMPYQYDGKRLSVNTTNPLQIQELGVDEVAFDSSQNRKIQSLNGIWQVEEGLWATPPPTFTHQVSVPGLLDMATPAYDFPVIDPAKFAIGPKKEFSSPTRTQIPIIIDDKRDAFWYKRNFIYDGEKPAVAIIKINKAKYHTTVWVNGEHIGENQHNFAPGYFDITKVLRAGGQENELLVRVGASMSGYQGEGTYMDGFDIEKTRYYPGIYDDVNLISTGSSKITHFQVAPVLGAEKIKVAVWLDNKADQPMNEPLLLQITDYHNRDSTIKAARTAPVSIPPNTQQQVYLEIPFADAKLWSPQTPNLYRLVVKTSNDQMESRFGMREFYFDDKTKLPTLNGKTTFLRGSNISFFRFTEDQNRGNKAWDKAWVRQLFKQIKSMHWNVVRTSLGPPPEFWYQIADEEGIMVVDEAPIWSLFREINLDAETLVYEYTAQLEQHWNYPCVIMWDAQNETPLNPPTLMALKVVRGIDLSDRAWDNGWGGPDRSTDPYEEHVYPHFSSFSDGASPLFDMNQLESLAYKVGLGFHDTIVHNPLIINEYGWLWLQRDGSPTRLTEKGYAVHLPNSTADERFEFWNYRLAAITESMRARRVEGVMNFTALSHSFPGCYTSDNFIDLESLTFEPHFVKYMRSAFAPLGLCIWNWDEKVDAGVAKNISVKVYNDDIDIWKGKVKMELVNGKNVTTSLEKELTELRIAKLKELSFDIVFPSEKGAYKLIATLIDNRGEVVQSIRKITIE